MARTQRRAAWGSISREQVVDAALRTLRSDGLDAVTIRGLAHDLGVAPMSLYRHVENRDDLLDAVVGRLLAECWRPAVAETDARAWLLALADNLRRLLVEQPAALHAYLRHPVTSPAAIERMEVALQVLRGLLGNDDDHVQHAYAAMQTYTIGFAALEAAREGWTPPPDADDVVHRLAEYTTPQSFSDGLGLLLDGIQGRAAR